jgi:hypothetical protein
VRKIRDEERSGKANITVIEEGKDADADFWAKVRSVPYTSMVCLAATYSAHFYCFTM